MFAGWPFVREDDVRRGFWPTGGSFGPRTRWVGGSWAKQRGADGARGGATGDASGSAGSRRSTTCRLGWTGTVDPRRVRGRGQSPDTACSSRCSGGLAAIPSWYARPARGLGRRGARAGRAVEAVRLSAVRLWWLWGCWIGGLGGDGYAWVESWAYPTRPDRNPSESGGLWPYSRYRCLDRWRRGGRQGGRPSAARGCHRVFGNTVKPARKLASRRRRSNVTNSCPAGAGPHHRSTRTERVSALIRRTREGTTRADERTARPVLRSLAGAWMESASNHPARGGALPSFHLFRLRQEREHGVVEARPGAAKPRHVESRVGVLRS